MPAAGTYTLIISLPAAASLQVGALGTITFDAGWYAYTGSALGSGGFARVSRHRELARGERETRHWHIDYLLGHPETAITRVVRTGDDADIECTVSQTVAADHDSIAAFGASDCTCGSHLAHAPKRDRLVTTVERAHKQPSPPATHDS